tara:strand:+ start:377 stop:580 length:204 start_codon:yes stop_codon:yes gene_type:complete
MKQIKDYMKKIEAHLASQVKTDKSTKKGLLAPTKSSAVSKETSSDLITIANFIQGIRTAREEMKNGN